MPRVLVLAVLLMTMVVKAEAQTAEETLIRIECEIADAQVERDLTRLEHVIADEFLVTVSDGRMLTKREALGVLASGELEILAAVLTDMTVRVYGETAVATYVSHLHVKVQGREMSASERDTDVFVRRSGEWRLVASQGTTIRRPE
jgi:ketosteroid isomerase-like protein